MGKQSRTKGSTGFLTNAMVDQLFEPILHFPLFVKLNCGKSSAVRGINKTPKTCLFFQTAQIINFRYFPPLLQHQLLDFVQFLRFAQFFKNTGGLSVVLASYCFQYLLIGHHFQSWQKQQIFLSRQFLDCTVSIGLARMLLSPLKKSETKK